MKKFAVLGRLAVALFGLAAPFANADDWKFTVADYSTLTQSGGRLRFAADSDWLPVELQANVLATLNYALDPSAKISSTDSVSLRDFYHGHIECLKKHGDYFTDESEKQQVYDSLGLKWWDATDENIQTYVQGVKILEEYYGQELRKILDQKTCELGIEYHTYETMSPEDEPTLDANSPRRHLFTGQSNLKPCHFNPEVATIGPFKNAGRLKAPQILQIAFLIDQEGVVHATWGSVDSLSRVVGHHAKQFE